MGTTVDTFETWSMRIDRKIRGKDGTWRTVWVVPAPWCVTRYINDARYIEGDSTPIHQRTRKPNVEYDTLVPKDEEFNIGQFNACAIKTTRNIAKGEELFASYGEGYNFKKFMPAKGPEGKAPEGKASEGKAPEGKSL